MIKSKLMKKMIDASASRGYFDHGWLQTSHTFSFAGYYNLHRVHFGMLRVLNDDRIAPGEGFDLHPHVNMEVISVPLKGYLRHGDSIGNIEMLAPGDIQVMSAGSGISHSEYNASRDHWLEMLQIWVFPKVKNLPPAYRQVDIRPCLERNKLGLLIAPDGTAPASIRQDAWFSMGTFDAGKTFDYHIHLQGNGVYLFVIEGEVVVDGDTLARRDGVGIWDTSVVPVQVLRESTVLLMEVPIR